MPKERALALQTELPKAKKPKLETVVLSHARHEEKIEAEIEKTDEMTDEEFEMIKERLGLGKRRSLSEVGKSLFSSLGKHLKKLLPEGDTSRSTQRTGPSPKVRLGQAFAFVGLQLIGGAANAQVHHGREQEQPAHQSTHHAHHRERPSHQAAHEARQEQREALTVQGFEEIGINSQDLARLIEQSFPNLVHGHRRIADVRYVRETQVIGPEYFNMEATSEDSGAAYAMATYMPGEQGGSITLRPRAFKEPSIQFWDYDTNFTTAMGTLVHEIGHSMLLSSDFIRRVRGEHIPLNVYTERFLQARTQHRRVDYRGMAVETQPVLLSILYLNAPVGAGTLRDTSINRLQDLYPEVPRRVIEAEVDEFFALDPDFDWDAGIGTFRKGMTDIYQQFARFKIQQRLQSLPPELAELIGFSELSDPAHRLTPMEQLTFDGRLQGDQALQSSYRHFRMMRADEIEAVSLESAMNVPGFSRLRADWQRTLRSIMESRAGQLKSRVDMDEYHLPSIGPSEQEMRAGLPNLLQSIMSDDLRDEWARIPQDKRSQVLNVLRQEANLLLHQGVVPGVIAAEAERVLRSTPLIAMNPL